MKFSALVVSSAALAVIGVVNSPIQGKAQLVLPEIVPGDVIQGIKGTTVNRSAQAGSRSSVSFGSNTSFGTSSSINATTGAYAASESFLAIDTAGSDTCSSGGCISSSVGGTDGLVTADLSNIRSAERSGSGYSSDPKDPAQSVNGSSTSSGTSTGQVALSGIRASNFLAIDGAGSSFKSQTHTIHSDNGNEDNDVMKNNTAEANVAADNQTANANSNTSINTLTNVDISTTEFVSSFQQAY